MGAPRAPLPFVQQRLVFFALLFGMTMYAVAVGVVLQTNDGKGLGPGEPGAFDTVVVAVGVAMALGAFVVRSMLHGKAEALPAAERSHARFRATLVPIAMIEAGCLFGLTVWLLDGRAVPGLVTALVLLSLAIAVVPLRDPDEGVR
jgi:hypothetical protein